MPSPVIAARTRIIALVEDNGPLSIQDLMDFGMTYKAATIIPNDEVIEFRADWKYHLTSDPA